MKRTSALVLLAVCLGAAFSGQKRPPGEIADGLKHELVGYLREHGMVPEEYVVSKFLDHDIVFIGEHHVIKHDVEFIQSLIPILYRNGITDLGIEFGCYELQDQVDSLLTAKTYDADLARRLLFKWASYWPYAEYQDLYRKAWELNKSLPKDAPKFRIVGLDYRPRWDLLREDMTPALFKAVWFKGPRDKHMAQVVMSEFVKKGRKALVYAGQYHAVTRFNTPVYDFEKKKLIRMNKESMGNLVYHKIRERAFNICLHYPWQTVDGPKTYDYPVGGAIDRVMREFGTKRVGFEVAGSPFGRLADKRTMFSLGRKDFVLGDFCDGYVYLEPFGNCQACTVDPLFITEKNLAEAVAYLTNASLKKKIVGRVQFLSIVTFETDFKRLYPDLE